MASAIQHQYMHLECNKVTYQNVLSIQLLHVLNLSPTGCTREHSQTAHTLIEGHFYCAIERYAVT